MAYSTRDKGLYLGLTNDKYATPAYYGGPKCKNLHWVLFGPNGAGKDTGIVTPNLAQLRRSVFIIDPKGEQAALTARHRAKFSRVIVINPCGLLTDTRPHLKSHGYNPLARPGFNPKDSNFNDNAVGIGDFLIKIDGHDKHFPTRAKALVSGLTMWVCIKCPNAANLPTMRRILTEPYGTEEHQPVGLFKTLIEIKEHGFEPITSKTNSFLHPNNETRGVIATAIGQTDWLDSPAYAEDLSKGGFDFADLKKELITVYVIIPATHLESHAIWLRLIVGACLRDLMRTPPGDGPPPLLILNEVGQLGFLEPLATGMGIARGFGVQIMTVWQSLAQIKTIYRDNFETFLGARGVLSSFAPKDWVTATYLSNLCGYRTELVTNYNATPGEPQTDRQETPQGFPLFRPEDLMRLPPGVLLNFVEPVEFPFLTRAPGYWQTPWAAGLDPNPYYREPQPNLRPPKTSPPPKTARNHRQALNDLHRRRKD